MDANKSVTATFKPIEYTLTVNISGSGSVTKNPDKTTYHYGDVVQLTATADTGWNFSAWSGDLSGAENPKSITIDGNKSVTATFIQNEYTLLVTVNGSGSVSKSPDMGTYHYGDVVQLTATAETDWNFSAWSGDLTGTGNPKSITIDGNKSVTATFAQGEYSLTITSVGGGHVTVDNNGPYHYGDVVHLTAVPDAGWSFSVWSGDLTSSANPESITIDGNKSVTANFTSSIKVFLPLLIR
jgi:hypothetical protein